MLEWQTYPHRRLNPLTGEWVLVSPQRTERPWQGLVERTESASEQTYDSGCYLCPGNHRAGGHRNPAYAGTFIFDNDFAALVRDTPEQSWSDHGLLMAETEPGISRVLCFSPRHDLTLSRMTANEIRSVVEAWCEQDRELRGLSLVNYVQIFENRGQMMGASNPHPHCQIWATHHVPNELRREQSAQEEWLLTHQNCLLCQYLSLERNGPRMVVENSEFAVVVPFWAVWPFETILIPRQHLSGMGDLSEEQRLGLADILKQVTTRYDNLFEVSCPYSMGFHQLPAGADPHAWHLHAHFYPPLLRSASVRKFMVGFELLAMPQRDFTPEAAAQRLSTLSAVHYSDIIKTPHVG